MLSISQAELAERAGISTGYVGEVETGQKFPSDEMLQKIAAALEVKAFRLLMSDEDVADSAGREAIYRAADDLKRKLGEQIDDFLRGTPPEEGDQQDDSGKRPVLRGPGL